MNTARSRGAGRSRRWLRARDEREQWSTYVQACSLVARGATVRVAGKVAVVVGTILSAVNQGSIIAGGHSTWATWVRVVVNYTTPFLVASVGYLAACRTPTEAPADNEGQP